MSGGNRCDVAGRRRRPRAASHGAIDLLRGEPERVEDVARREDLDAHEPRTLDLPRQDQMTIEPASTRLEGGEAHPRVQRDARLLWQDRTGPKAVATSTTRSKVARTSGVSQRSDDRGRSALRTCGPGCGRIPHRVRRRRPRHVPIMQRICNRHVTAGTCPGNASRRRLSGVDATPRGPLRRVESRIAVNTPTRAFPRPASGFFRCCGSGPSR